MKIIAAKATKRKREEGKDTQIYFDDHILNPKKIETFQKRKFVKDDVPESPSAGNFLSRFSPAILESDKRPATPENITYHTPISDNSETPINLTYHSPDLRIPGTPGQSISLDPENPSSASFDHSLQEELQHESLTAFLERWKSILANRSSLQIQTSSPHGLSIESKKNLARKLTDETHTAVSEDQTAHNLAWTCPHQTDYPGYDFKFI